MAYGISEPNMFYRRMLPSFMQGLSVHDFLFTLGNTWMLTYQKQHGCWNFRHYVLHCRKKKEQSLISFDAKGVITNKFWLSFVKQTQTKWEILQISKPAGEHYMMQKAPKATTLSFRWEKKKMTKLIRKNLSWSAAQHAPR